MTKPFLKPCPFCGANPHWKLSKLKHDQLHGEPYQDRQISCPKGHAQMQGPEDFVVKNWNTRVEVTS